MYVAYAATSGEPKGQLWFLQGGPGGSGDVFAGLYDNFFADFAKDYDLYVLEHRGVEWSDALECVDNG